MQNKNKDAATLKWLQQFWTYKWSRLEGYLLVAHRKSAVTWMALFLVEDYIFLGCFKILN